MPYSKQRIVRGIQKLLAGVPPDFLAPAIARYRQLRWSRIKNGPGEMITWPVGAGAKLLLDKRNDLTRLLIEEDFESGERRLLKRLLRPGDTFVDVGANIGLFSAIAGKIVGNNGVVVAIEPSARTSALLRIQIEENGLHNVIVESVGLSAVPDTLELYESVLDADPYNSFGEPIVDGHFERVKVAVKTLDNVAREHLMNRPIRLIKIDTEGWETRVLEGGTKTLSCQEAPDLIVEFCEAALASAGTSCLLLHGRLEKLGYRLHLIDGQSGSLTPLDHPQPFDYVNIFATKSSCDHWGRKRR